MIDARNIPIGLVQMSMGLDPADNLGRAKEMIQQAAREGAKVICLPELFRSRYFCQKEDASLRIEQVRRNWPFLRDRRIDAYAGPDRRFLDDGPGGRRA